MRRTNLLTWVTGTAASRHGPRRFISMGLAIACPAFILCRLVDQNDAADQILLISLLVAIGVGEALALTGLMVAFAESVSASHFGVFNISAILGLLVGSLVFGDYDRRGGWNVVTAVLGGLSGLGLVLSHVWIGRDVVLATTPPESRPPDVFNPPEPSVVVTGPPSPVKCVMEKTHVLLSSRVDRGAISSVHVV